MKRFPSRIALALLTAFFAHVAIAAEPLATVNGTAIPSSRAAAMLDEQRAQGAEDTQQLRDAIREELIRREILAQEASKKGLEKKPEIQAQMELARQAILIRAYIQDYVVTNPVTDADVRKEYEDIKGRMGSKEYKPRHVLVETEGEANEIIAKLRAGESFEELAKRSLDPGSRERGGELGWSSPGMFVEPFAEAMVALEKGQYSAAPVRSDFGFHVIMLDDVRELQAPPIDDVKPQLEQRLQQQRIEQHLMELRAKADVK